MSKYNVGDRFMIEIAELYHVRPNEKKTVDEKIIPPATLYRIKGFSAAAWDDRGLDKLTQLGKPKEILRPYRDAATLRWLGKTENLTTAERAQLRRADAVPPHVRRFITEKLETLRSEIMELEKEYDFLWKYLNGFYEEDQDDAEL